MPDYENYEDVMTLLKDAQEAEFDNREKVREVTYFLKKDDGQWEPSIIENMDNRPRYTFDKCNPVVDSIAGEMEQNEFGIKVRPAGGEASKKTAELYDGLIRNIQSMSNAKHVFNAAGRKMVESGFDAWRVVQDWSDTDSMDQDLFIRKIANAVDRVWFDTGAEMQDMSDANWCFVLQALTKQEYKERFPEGSIESVRDMKTNEVYFYKPDFVIVGEFLYKSPIEKELVLMSNNAVYVDDEDFQKVKDELEQEGITEVRRRKKKSHEVKTRLFDGKTWLKPAQKTVFDYIPVIPTYGNFDITEDKIIYRGVTNKLMDSQRVYNYAQSRAVEEGALAPRAKYWMTREQAKSDVDTLQTMNTNANPVQTYTHVDNHPAPYWSGGAQVNPGLQQTAQDMTQNLIGSSGIFAANQGNAPDQSGYAIELQQKKGDNSSIKYYTSQEIAICHTARILVNAIPKVYDTKRQVRILGEDGSSKIETINDVVIDTQTRKTVELNDVRKGKYDVTCSMGPAFQNRQQETAKAFIDVASLDPSIIAQGKDVWLSNLSAPGMDIMAQRARKQLFEAGQIPDEQMTDEEKERAQAMIEQAALEAEAAAAKGPTVMEQALIEQTQANTADISSRADERLGKLAQNARKMELEEARFAHQLDQDSIRLILEQQKAQRETDNLIMQSIKSMAETLETLKKASGVDVIVSPKVAEAYGNQADLVVDSQEAIK